jgi:hypothetical protein
LRNGYYTELPIRLYFYAGASVVLRDCVAEIDAARGRICVGGAIWYINLSRANADLGRGRMRDVFAIQRRVRISGRRMNEEERRAEVERARGAARGGDE